MHAIPATLKCPQCGRAIQREHWREWFKDTRVGVVTNAALQLAILLGLIAITYASEGRQALRQVLPWLSRLALHASWVLPLLWLFAPHLVHRHHIDTERQSQAQRRWMRRWAHVIICGFGVLAVLSWVVLSAPGFRFPSWSAR